MFQSIDACWCCKCVENSNWNVSVILELTMYNTGHQNCYNNHTTLPEHCLNVGKQHCHNVCTMLPECCFNIGPQCSYNIACTLSQHWSPLLGNTIVTTFRQFCLNFVSTVVPNDGERCCHSIHTSLVQYC